MQPKGITVDEYIASLPEDRKAAMTKLRKTINKNLPKGFEECMSYGMMGYVVPHSIYPQGYNCDPKLPLPFIAIGSQKNFIALHHLGIYGDKNLFDWFVAEYEKTVPSKLDMGKGCIRFKKMDQIPYDLIGALVAKFGVDEYINNVTTTLAARKKS